MLNEPAEPPKRPNDWIISLILVVIWGVGLLSVTTLQPDIPKSMLVVGTVFFIVLIPTMKDLVRSLDRKVNGKTALHDESSESGP